MKKIILVLSVVAIVSTAAFAEMTVEELRSKENMLNEGYSEATIQCVHQNSGEYKPKPTNIWQKIGFKTWNYIDPDSPKARDDYRHDIKQYSSYSDL